MKSEHLALFVLGLSLQQEGRPEEAVACYEKAIRLRPDFVEACRNAGIACHLQGRMEEALSFYRQALAINPSLAELHYNSGNALQDLGDPDAAVAAYREALRLLPEYPEASYNLGRVLHKIGRNEEAAESYRLALEFRPGLSRAWNNLGIILKEQNRLPDATEAYRRALQAEPGLPEAHFNLGVALQIQGNFHEGLLCYERALRHDPSYAPARWLGHLSLPVIYRARQEVEYHRLRFLKNLDRLAAETRLDDSGRIREALAGCSSTTNFYLAYQGRNDRDLQERYGTLVCRIMAAAFPRWSEPLPMPEAGHGGKIRVGFVSSFMCAHTVGEFLLGWIANIAPEAFEIYGYHIGRNQDGITELIRQRCRRFHQLGNEIEPAARQIHSDRLHILIYTDVGMNAPATQLAALRLAPVQCKGWGHPVTTGLRTIDYYLSSDLMEPEDAREHYTETLIRLPHLALVCREPKLPENPKTREQLDIPAGSVVYLSTQSLFKYLPDFDDIYPRIALEVPDACFVFLSHPEPQITASFKDRLSAAFSRQGLIIDQWCRFQPRLSFPDFLSLNGAADILLDTFCWSGGKTTLEAIACGLPVVTCPGRFMRGRHAYAMLRMMGISETIAADENAYIRIAVELGTDPVFRSRIAQKTRENRYRLYGDTSCIRGLEAFFRRVVHGERP